jgi:diguanylate cyclase (GGDEF)-like protein
MIDLPAEENVQERSAGLFLLPLAVAAALWIVRFLPLTNQTEPLPNPALLGLSLIAAVLSLIAAWRSKGHGAGAFALLAASALASSVAVQAESLSDPIGVAGYLTVLGATSCLLLMLREREVGRGLSPQVVLDLIPLTIVVSVASWVFIAGPYLSATGVGAGDKLAAVLHAAGAASLFAMGAAGLIDRRRRPVQVDSTLVLVFSCLVAVADALWTQRLAEFPIRVHLPEGLLGLALVLGGIAAATAIRRATSSDVSAGTLQRVRAERWSSQLQNVALATLLLLAGGQAVFGEPVRFGTAVAVGGALAMLVFFVTRESVVIRRERHLHQEIGELSEKIDGLISQVGRDPLTGLLNHRAVHERLDHELANGRANGDAVAVILVDVDNFKTVNDTLGHQAGDRVLHAVASILTAACRGSDVAARYAGDEFMLVLPGLNEDHAAAVGTRILEEVRRANNDLDLGKEVSVSLSIGVAVTHRCQRSMAQTVAIADAAMYDAKEGGKNRVVVVNADTLEISEPIHMLRSVDESMAAALIASPWATVDRRRAG